MALTLTLVLVRLVFIVFLGLSFNVTFSGDYESLELVETLPDSLVKQFQERLPKSNVVAASLANRHRGYANQDRTFSYRQHDGLELMAVADGHGGEEASSYLASKSQGIWPALRHFKSANLSRTIKSACLAVNRQMHRQLKTKAGSTLAGIVTPPDDPYLYIFNVADSPAYVVLKNGDVLRTVNHDASNIQEILRFIQAGIHNRDLGYSSSERRFCFRDASGNEAGLQPSRDFGRGAGELEAFKPEPYVYRVKKDDVAFVSIFSDGPYDAWSSESQSYKGFMYDFISKVLAVTKGKGTLMPDMLERLTADYLTAFDDDMSVMIKNVNNDGIKEDKHYFDDDMSVMINNDGMKEYKNYSINKHTLSLCQALSYFIKDKLAAI